MTVITTAQYQQLFGWRVQECGGGSFLSLGVGMVGVAIHVPLSGLVADDLRRQSIKGPILGINQHPRRWVFLADPNDLILTPAELPRGVELLSCPKRLALPSAPHESVTWIDPPKPHRRWLPTLAAIISAAASALDAPHGRLG